MTVSAMTVRAMTVLARRAPVIVLLAACWCALWGEISPANVVAGIVLGGAVVAATGVGAGVVPGVSVTEAGVRIAPLLRLLGIVLGDLVRSTINVAREVLTPTDHTDEAIVRVDTGPAGARHLLLLTVAVTLTPGTAVVDVDPETGALTLHVLHADTAPAVRRHIARLVELADRAFPPAGEPAAPETRSLGEAP